MFPAQEELHGTVLSTLIYYGLYTGFMGFQSFSKFYLLSQQKKNKKSDEFINLKTVKVRI